MLQNSARVEAAAGGEGRRCFVMVSWGWGRKEEGAVEGEGRRFGGRKGGKGPIGCDFLVFSLFFVAFGARYGLV